MLFATFTRFASAIALCVPIYTTFPNHARASDWGCEVLLCLSNPGGPTEFSECRPPIERLWRHLAKGRSFPSCIGVGFSATKPRYEPYFCDEGFRLVSRNGQASRKEVGCISTERQEVAVNHCQTYGDGRRGINGSGARWERVGQGYVCKAFVSKPANVRSKPRYIDLNIQGAGVQRVWF